jgi:hypothetical protein
MCRRQENITGATLRAPPPRQLPSQREARAFVRAPRGKRNEEPFSALRSQVSCCSAPVVCCATSADLLIITVSISRSPQLRWAKVVAALSPLRAY